MAAARLTGVVWHDPQASDECVAWEKGSVRVMGAAAVEVRTVTASGPAGSAPAAWQCRQASRPPPSERTVLS